MAVESDGKIVVAGGASKNTSYSYDFALVRYNSDGSLDTSFDGDGIVRTDFGSTERAYSVAIQADGKIVVGGRHMTRATALAWHVITRMGLWIRASAVTAKLQRVSQTLRCIP